MRSLYCYRIAIVEGFRGLCKFNARPFEPKGDQPVAPTPLLRTLRTLRLISASDSSYFVTFVPSVVKSFFLLAAWPR